MSRVNSLVIMYKFNSTILHRHYSYTPESLHGMWQPPPLEGINTFIVSVSALYNSDSHYGEGSSWNSCERIDTNCLIGKQLTIL